MKYLISIVLLCLWPVINFAGANLIEEYDFGVVVQFYLINVSFFSILAWAAYKFTGKRPIGLVLIYFTVLFFYLFPAIRAALGDAIRFRTLLLAVCILAVVIVTIVSRKFSRQAFERAALYVSMGLVGLSLVGLIGGLLTMAPSPDRQQVSETNQQEASFKVSPNVYYIILDAYGRSDQLNNVFGFDNTPMIQSLNGDGFRVLSNSYTAFPVTEYSIGSIFNMAPILSASREHYAKRFESEVFQRFRRAGYRITVLDEGQCPLYGVCLAKEAQGTAAFGNLQQNLLRLTPLFEIILRYGPHLYGDLRATVQDFDIALSESELKKPTFVYGHIMFPHPPYTWDASCTLKIPKDLIDVENYLFTSRDRYVDQLQCVNKQTLKLVSDLVQRDPQAIIVLQSDHGPGFIYRENSAGTDFRFEGYKDWYRAALEERYAVFNAWRMPDNCQGMLSDSLITVDTFRVIFSCLQDTPFIAKNDESFWVDRRKVMSVNKIRIGDKWLLNGI